MTFDFSPTIWSKAVLHQASQLAPLKAPREFKGQPEAVAKVEPFLKVAHFPHALITGEPGIGKTTFARWIAGRRAEQYTELHCPVHLDQMPATGVVFLDEIHRVTKPEWLYPIMDNVTVTILGATTRPENLDPALTSRFGTMRIKLRRYTNADMVSILWAMIRGGDHLDLPDVSDEHIEMLAGASAGNPRQLESIVKYAKALGTYDPQVVLSAARVTPDGLTESHIDILVALKKIGRAAGLDTLARHTFIDPDTIQDCERYLLEKGLIKLTPSGRKISAQGTHYIEILEKS